MKRTNLELKTKHSSNASFNLWPFLLQLPLEELNLHLDFISHENPFLEVKHSRKTDNSPSCEFLKDLIFDLGFFHKKVSKQPILSLFLAKLFQLDSAHAASLKKCFLKVNSTNAIEQKEALVFQLDGLGDIDDELCGLILKTVEDTRKLDIFLKRKNFNESISIAKNFLKVSTAKYKNNSKQIIPDFFVDVEDDIVVNINKDYYPDVTIQENFLSEHDNAKWKLKEAHEIANLIEFRKSVLHKIIFLITEKQMSFFMGGELKPLSMSVLANELSFAKSTISRAVSNKYIKSKRGVYPLKFFFTNAVASKELSSSQIKNFLKEQISHENKENPLTDDDILKLIEQRFGINIVRRTITKYRKFLGIVSSKERKKTYN